MSQRTILLALAAVAAAILGLPRKVSGGGDIEWVTFADQTATRLVADPAVGLNNPDEKDYAWADVDGDGDIDLVGVYKQLGTTTGKRRNVLFLNESGVLVDRTLEYGSASAALLPDGSPSQGLLDLTNDRDVLLADVNGDLWPDIVTATTQSGGPGGTAGDKVISHPRIYINLGDDPPGSGVWQGFLFDDVDRVPTMPAEPRFLSVSAGDVDEDGDLDLYLTDQQQGGPRPVDIDNRLWINDGSGYFTDETTLRMTFDQYEVSMSEASHIRDMNGDGALDVVFTDALNAPTAVSVVYNDPETPGFFQKMPREFVYTQSPYHVSVGDLNNDTLLDLVISDAGVDKYLLNVGNGPDGLANFTTSQPFIGAPPQFDGNNFIADLNRDGFNDVLIANVDVDLPSCNNPSHIYANRGLQPDGFLITMQDFGTVGIDPLHLRGVHDFAVFDIDGDTWPDLVIGNCLGTRVYINQPPTVLAFAYPQGLPDIVPPEQPHTFTVEITAQGVVEPEPGTGMQHVSVSGGPFFSSPMQVLSETTYLATLPAGSCLDVYSFYFSAGVIGGGTNTDPADAPATTYQAVVATDAEITFEEDVEGDVSAWTIVSDPSLTSGAWEQADPIITLNASMTASPGEDAQPDPAIKAFVTQNCLAEPCNATDFEVDGGPTDLISPLIDLEGADANISYYRWFYSSSTSGTDVLETAVTNNGNDPSPTWVIVEQVSSTFDGVDTAWEQASFRVSDFVTPTAEVRVRFRTQDVSPASVVEAGIDLFSVETITCECLCPADLSGDGERNGGDIQGFVNCLLGIGTNCVCAETDGQAGLDLQDVSVFVDNLLAGAPCGA